MTLSMINQMADRTAAFFEWWNEWACKGDRLECIYDDDYGCKIFVVYDCTGCEKIKFHNEQGVLYADLGKAVPC